MTPVVATYRRRGRGVFGVVLDERTFVVLASCPVRPEGAGAIFGAIGDALAICDATPEWKVVRS